MSRNICDNEPRSSAGFLAVALLLAIAPGIAWVIFALPGSPAYGVPTQGREGILYTAVVIIVALIHAGTACLVAQAVPDSPRPACMARIARSVFVTALIAPVTMALTLCLSYAALNLRIASSYEDAAASESSRAMARGMWGSTLDQTSPLVPVYRIRGIGIEIVGEAQPTGARYESGGQSFDYSPQPPWYESYGWPWRCLASPIILESRRPALGQAFFDPRPDQLKWSTLCDQAINARLLPVGFAGDVLVSLAALALIRNGPAGVRAIWRSHHGRCPACGYTTGASRVCTECGNALRRRGGARHGRRGRAEQR